MNNRAPNPPPAGQDPCDPVASARSFPTAAMPAAVGRTPRIHSEAGESRRKWRNVHVGRAVLAIHGRTITEVVAGVIAWAICSLRQKTESKPSIQEMER